MVVTFEGEGTVISPQGFQKYFKVLVLKLDHR